MRERDRGATTLVLLLRGNECKRRRGIWRKSQQRSCCPPGNRGPIPLSQISHFLPSQEDQGEDPDLITCPSRMHHVSPYTRHGPQRGIEAKARVGPSRREEIVVRNKKEVIQRSRMWDGSRCESGALRISGAKVSGRCRNDGSVLASHAEERRHDSDPAGH
jgi:hypothetical protein